MVVLPAVLVLVLVLVVLLLDGLLAVLVLVEGQLTLVPNSNLFDFLYEVFLLWSEPEMGVNSSIRILHHRRNHRKLCKCTFFTLQASKPSLSFFVPVSLHCSLLMTKDHKWLSIGQIACNCGDDFVWLFSSLLELLYNISKCLATTSSPHHRLTRTTKKSTYMH